MDVNIRWHTNGGNELEIKSLYLAITSFQRHTDNQFTPHIIYNGNNCDDFYKLVHNQLPGINIINQTTYGPTFVFAAKGSWWKWKPFYFPEIGGIQVVLDTDMIFVRKPDFLFNWLDNTADFLFIKDTYLSRASGCGSFSDKIRGRSDDCINSGLVAMRPEKAALFQSSLIQIANNHYKQGRRMTLAIDEQGAVNATIAMLEHTKYITVERVDRSHMLTWPPLIAHIPVASCIHFICGSKFWLGKLYDKLAHLALYGTMDAEDQKNLHELSLNSP